MAIDEGETVVLRAEFRDDSGALTDPSTPVEVTVIGPGGTIDDAVTVSKQSTGVFEHKVDATASGQYEFKFVSADGAVEQGDFYASRDTTDT